MSKHVIDHLKTSDAERVSEKFSHIEGDKLPRPQTLAMQQRQRKPADTRLKKYLSIARRDEG